MQIQVFKIRRDATYDRSDPMPTSTSLYAIIEYLYPWVFAVNGSGVWVSRLLSMTYSSVFCSRIIQVVFDRILRPVAQQFLYHD
jgi:hypothetical protein